MNDLNQGVGQVGTLKWKQFRDGVLIDEWTSKNTATNQGLAYMQNTAFQRGPTLVTPKASWYVGIFEGTALTAAAKKVLTAATVAAGVTEINDTNYSVTGRILWDVNDAAGNNDDTDRVITNSTVPAVFTMTVAKTVVGAFIVSELASGGVSATDTLFSISDFAAARITQIGDVLQVTYDSTITSA